MEKIFRNKKVILIAFFTAFSVASVPVMANNSNKTIPVEMKFMGYIKNQLLFKLNFAGTPENNEFTVVIRDDQNNILYRDNIKGENFSKSFLLNTDEIGDDNLQFEVINKKTKESVVYEVNRNSGAKEDLTISELK
jgi:hypothetical protein